MTAYIYTLRDPRTNGARYIGKTTNVKARMRGHRAARCDRYEGWFTRRDLWLRDLDAAGLEPIIEILEEVEGNGWRAVERRWIEHYRAQGADLTNGMLCHGWSESAWELQRRRKEYWARRRAAQQ